MIEHVFPTILTNTHKRAGLQEHMMRAAYLVLGHFSLNLALNDE